MNTKKEITLFNKEYIVEDTPLNVLNTIQKFSEKMGLLTDKFPHYTYNIQLEHKDKNLSRATINIIKHGT